MKKNYDYNGPVSSVTLVEGVVNLVAGGRPYELEPTEPKVKKLVKLGYLVESKSKIKSAKPVPVKLVKKEGSEKPQKKKPVKKTTTNPKPSDNGKK